jgi:2,4-dienoyl-CoA reductase-like NADH-dependent reductase (Old Yellow Enzyme family)
MRFAIAVCRAIRSEIGNDMPLLWKTNCSDYTGGGEDLAGYAEVAGALAAEGVDLIEVSGGVKEQIKLRGRLKKRAGEREAYFEQAVKPFRDAVGGKTLAITGGIRSRSVAETLLDNGVDMVGVCRPVISEPDFPKRLFASADYEKSRCISCNKCLLHIAQHPLECVHFNG